MKVLVQDFSELPKLGVAGFLSHWSAEILIAAAGKRGFHREATVYILGVGRHKKMTRRVLAFVLTFTSGAIVGHVGFPSVGWPFTGHGVVLAQTRKPVMMTRLYTGPDNQTHAEEVEVKFAGNVFKMLPVTGAELHRGFAGSVADWHTAPRRQYVITLSGLGEIEVAGGKKISIEPGHIDLVEDVRGKGHITKVTGTEDRVTLWLPLSDQSNR